VEVLLILGSPVVGKRCPCQDIASRGKNLGLETKSHFVRSSNYTYSKVYLVCEQKEKRVCVINFDFHTVKLTKYGKCKRQINKHNNL